jgi:hypothetical protein
MHRSRLPSHGQKVDAGIILSPPQRLLKNMKFEGIEIALEGIWYEDNRCAPIFSGCLHTRYLLAQFQLFLRISYSLKASAEERGHNHLSSRNLERCKTGTPEWKKTKRRNRKPGTYERHLWFGFPVDSKYKALQSYMVHIFHQNYTACNFNIQLAIFDNKH